MSSLRIYDHSDYRRFLRAWLDAVPSRSMRGTAPKAGVSVALLSGIVNGKKALDLSRIPAFVKALRLDPDEAVYFADLVAQEHAGTEELRASARERVQATRQFRDVRAIDVDTWQVIGHIRNAAILELSLCHGWRDDPEWIAARLRVSCTAAQAAESLSLLERVGALERGADGHLRSSDEVWSTGHATNQRLVALALMKLHHAVLDEAHAALDQVAGKQRQFGTLTFAFDSSQLPELEARVLRFQEEVIHLAKQSSKDADMVYHLGTQLFPLCHAGEAEGEGEG